MGNVAATSLSEPLEIGEYRVVYPSTVCKCPQQRYDPDRLLDKVMKRVDLHFCLYANLKIAWLSGRYRICGLDIPEEIVDLIDAFAYSEFTNSEGKIVFEPVPTTFTIRLKNKYKREVILQTARPLPNSLKQTIFRKWRFQCAKWESSILDHAASHSRDQSQKPASEREEEEMYTEKDKNSELSRREERKIRNVKRRKH
jgi:hypothetical protein